ncbi:MAG: DUF373 family protein, partial [Nitrososphaeraceae archaeon]
MSNGNNGENLLGRDLISRQNSFNCIIVLCIDRDDDLGSKGGIDTPVIGRDSCINAGIR